jgi:hypothetical protein
VPAARCRHVPGRSPKYLDLALEKPPHRMPIEPSRWHGPCLLQVPDSHRPIGPPQMRPGQMQTKKQYPSRPLGKHRGARFLARLIQVLEFHGTLTLKMTETGKPHISTFVIFLIPKPEVSRNCRAGIGRQSANRGKVR